MTMLRLLLRDQLNTDHSWFATRDPDVLYVLMEVRQETDYVLNHTQKILALPLHHDYRPTNGCNLRASQPGKRSGASSAATQTQGTPGAVIG